MDIRRDTAGANSLNRSVDQYRKWRPYSGAMVSTGDTAPTFTATYRGSDHETFDLEEHLGDGPVVLAFFPGAFTPPCTNEMVALQEHIGRFEDAGATVFGISADSAYDLELALPDLGLHGIVNRAVFVGDEAGTVTYTWVADDPINEPDYDELVEAVEAA